MAKKIVPVLILGSLLSTQCLAAEAMTVDATGQVGIGISDPTELLHLFTSDPELKMRLEQGSADNAWAYAVVNSNPSRPNAFRISLQGTGGPEVDIIGRNDPLGEPTMVVDGSIRVTNIEFSSSREFKTAISALDGRAILARVADLPMAQWRYKTEGASAFHFGPMAEDFNNMFELTGNNKTISVVDANGIALAAIQGLVAELEERDAKIDQLANEMTALRALVHSLVK